MTSEKQFEILNVPEQKGLNHLMVFQCEVERRTPLHSRQWLLPAVATATGPSHQDSTRSSNHGEGKSKNLNQRCKGLEETSDQSFVFRRSSCCISTLTPCLFIRLRRDCTEKTHSFLLSKKIPPWKL
ncbi:hypothetical protein TNCT_196931 [Trichonephila clavata]|uniref:Uncharacterized protein n=1 Tax=Trichonephila clavata TaxID=2740835 RepID=A0A8X6HJQ1_TRICU|nr:hypothetical protein TNCT_196931 [Trichonephila clavata]